MEVGKLSPRRQPCSVRPLPYTDPMKTQPDNSGREMESGPVLLHGADSPSSGVISPSRIDEFEIAFLDADESFCHLKQNGRYICGQGFGEQHGWSWCGEDSCPGCGKPLCPDCMLIWRETINS